jgi:hypothetical protein
MAEIRGNEARVPAGEKPPETITHDDGKRYRPTWKDVSSEEDIRAGVQVYIIQAMGLPLDDEDDPPFDVEVEDEVDDEDKK